MILVAAWPSDTCSCINIVTRDDVKQQFVEAHLPPMQIADLITQLKAQNTPTALGYVERLEPLLLRQRMAGMLGGVMFRVM